MRKRRKKVKAKNRTLFYLVFWFVVSSCYLTGSKCSNLSSKDIAGYYFTTNEYNNSYIEILEDGKCVLHYCNHDTSIVETSTWFYDSLYCEVHFHSFRWFGLPNDMYKDAKLRSHTTFKYKRGRLTMFDQNLDFKRGGYWKRWKFFNANPCFVK